MYTPELLSPEEIEEKSSLLDNWSLLEEHYLVSVFEFPDFLNALEFTVKVV